MPRNHFRHPFMPLEPKERKRNNGFNVRLSPEDEMKRSHLNSLYKQFITTLHMNSANSILEDQLKTNKIDLTNLKELSTKLRKELGITNVESKPIVSGNPEQIILAKEEEVKNAILNALSYNFNKQTKDQKAKRLLIFKTLGIEFNPSDEKLPVNTDRTFISSNQHENCRKYYIEGDDYCYEFFNDHYFNPEKDYCLSIGSCSFYPVKNEENFNYNFYMIYLAKTFNVIKQKGIIFSHYKSKPFSKTNEKFDNLDVIDSKHVIAEVDEFDCAKIYNSFKNYSKPIPPDLFETRYNQALKLRNMKSGDYAILNFGQFQQLFGFLITMKMMPGNSWRKLGKFNGYIYRAVLSCFQYGNECTAKFTFVIDTLHRIVIFKLIGSHCDNCNREQKRLGYKSFRNLYLNKGIGTDDIAKRVMIDYTPCFYSCVEPLGQPPDWGPVVRKRQKIN